MRHRNIRGRLGRRTSHRTATVKSLVRALFLNERIITTDAKAKAVRRSAEKLITVARDNSIHSRRKIQRFLQDRTLLATLFNEIAPRFNGRNGGYTRIIRLARQRAGDNANMALLELVVTKTEIKTHDKKKRSKKSANGVAESSEAQATQQDAPSDQQLKTKTGGQGREKKKSQIGHKTSKKGKEKMQEEGAVAKDMEKAPHEEVAEDSAEEHKQGKKNFLGGLRKFFRTDT
ncbi:MAG: 50S ribosomal protein L17 [Candidatus Omnitrophica bacterium]|nr:50S ribosomal protein L17 [Candidatus Omnitrophota bacterium]